MVAVYSHTRRDKLETKGSAGEAGSAPLLVHDFIKDFRSDTVNLSLGLYFFFSLQNLSSFCHISVPNSKCIIYLDFKWQTSTELSVGDTDSEVLS